MSTHVRHAAQGDPDSRWLGDALIGDLHAAAIELGLYRDALLAGLPRRFTAQLPTAPSPSAQFLMDLSNLNSTGSLTGGTVPLRVWLQSACALASTRPEALLFESALSEVEQVINERAQVAPVRGNGMSGWRQRARAVCAPSADGETHRLRSIPSVDRDGIIRGQSVALRDPNARPVRSGLLRARSMRPGEPDIIEPVRVLSLNEMPEGLLAVPATLMARLGLTSGQHGGWQLEQVGAVQVTQVERIMLEVTEELEVEGIRGLRLESLLFGCLLRVQAEGLAGLSVEPEGLAPFLVREIEPMPHAVPSVLQLGPRTSVEVFFPRAKAGVDMVVLADVSGSMSLPDVIGEHGAPIERMRAQKEALGNLLTVRQQLAGRVSRLALVAFDTECRPVFPAHDGMVELDARSDAREWKRFAAAIDRLKPTGQLTDISRALAHAAQLLCKHGHPENERLVVLISDGAHAPTPKKAGELEPAMEDPVSLVADLHERLEVRLHAVAVSNREQFQRLASANGWNVDNSAAVPDHDLLAKLADEGEGKISFTGAKHEIVRFFGDLGEGYVRRLGQLLPASAGLAPEERKLLAQESALRGQACAEAARGAKLEDIESLSAVTQALFRRWSDSNHVARRSHGYGLFDSLGAETSETLRALAEPALTAPMFVAFLGAAQRLLRGDGWRDHPEAELRRLLSDERQLHHRLRALTFSRGATPETVHEQLFDTCADDVGWMHLQELILRGMKELFDSALRAMERAEPPSDHQVIRIVM